MSDESVSKARRSPPNVTQLVVSAKGAAASKASAAKLSVKSAAAKPGRPVRPTPVTEMPTIEKERPPAKRQPVGEGRKPARRTVSVFAYASLFLLVVLPTLLVGFYFAFIASDQYRSEMRFAVRGTQQGPLAQFGLSALPGNTSQAADAYIVIDYINSRQMMQDVRDQLGIDLREFYARDSIDPLYRVDPNMPLVEFVKYWRWMINAGFNSTTSITKVEVTAFSAEDANIITDAILQVSTKLVNDLSTEARVQLIATAEDEVDRTELRLSNVRVLLEQFRDREQQLNPAAVAQAGQELIQGIQREIINLEARRSALLDSVRPDAPSVRIIDRQLAAQRIELEKQRELFGSGGNETGERNLSAIVSDYNSLVLEEEFARQAYTSALSSLETSQAEARKQERYFAIIVAPTLPEVSLYPARLLNTLIAFFCGLILWLIVYLLGQAVRDHMV